jgi:predicted nucleic acid-binding Zn ribbon protein
MKRVITSVPGISLKGTGWSTDNYSVTDRGAQAVSDKADKKDRVVSFPGQLHKGRTGA